MEKRKVTHKASWMEEPDQFRASRPSPPPSERPKCPTCDIPLRTSPEGGLFCWICERRYDPSQLKAVKPPEPPKATHPKAGQDRPVAKDEVGEEMDFELEMEEGSVDDEAPDEEGAEEENAPDVDDNDEGTDEGETEEVKPIEEGDEDEEELEFELEEETSSKNEWTQVGDDGNNAELTEDDKKDRAEEETESEEGETSEEDEELDFEVSDEEVEGEGSEDEEEQGSDVEGNEDEESVDFELELDGDDGVDGGEIVAEDEDASAGPKEPGQKVKKRFIDQSEIEFD